MPMSFGAFLFAVIMASIVSFIVGYEFAKHRKDDEYR